MNCKKAEEYLVEYLYQELPAKKTLQIEKHLHGCTHCKSTLESWRAIHRAYQRSADEPQIAPYTKQKILAVAEEELVRTPSWREKLLWGLKIATVPIAIFILVLFLNTREKGTDLAMKKQVAPAAPVVETEKLEDAVPKPEQSSGSVRSTELADYDETKAKTRERESAPIGQLSSRLEGRADRESPQKKTDSPYGSPDVATASPVPSANAPQEIARENDYRDQVAQNEPSVKASRIAAVSKNAAEEPFEMAQQSLQNKDLKEGQDFLRKAISNDPQKSLASKLHQEGISYQNKGEYVNAIIQYEQVPANYRDYAKLDDVLIRLGDSYAEVGQFNKAVQAYSQVSQSQQKIAKERIERLQKKQEAREQLKSLGYVGEKE